MDNVTRADLLPKLKFKKLREDAVIPKYATEGSAGLDLVATSEDVSNYPLYVEYGTGLAVEIPFGHVGLLCPRSSISNTVYSVANSLGIIDSDYRGELKVRLRKTSHLGKDYNVGDKIAQLVIVPIPMFEVMEVDELSDTQRGSGGFGSTGK